MGPGSVDREELLQNFADAAVHRTRRYSQEGPINVGVPIGPLGLPTDDVEPRWQHLFGALQVCGNADVDKVAIKDLRA